MKTMKVEIAKVVLLAAVVCASAGALLGRALDTIWRRHHA